MRLRIANETEQVCVMDEKKSGEALLQWHERTERALPWRGETNAYRIWVSETMLQQTRASVAAERYGAFLRAFPDIRALAEADEQQVLALWQGLGYYARARNMHRAAKQICREYSGVFPQSEQELRKLPGVGAYTACAVLSMAYGQPVAAIDANLARVISRAYALHGFLENNKSLLEELGCQWLRACAMDRPGDFNRALMGLGALVCIAKKPNCEACPIALWCEALQQGEQEVLPEKMPKKQRKEEWHALVIAVFGKKVLLRQRPEKGMLAGLWEFPHYAFAEDALSASAGAQGLAEDGLQAVPAQDEEIGRSDFAFTHRLWHLRAWQYRLQNDNAQSPYLLADRALLLAMPMPSVMEPYRQIALELLTKAD